jgi:hypothetical protein
MSTRTWDEMSLNRLSALITDPEDPPFYSPIATTPTTPLDSHSQRPSPRPSPEGGSMRTEYYSPTFVPPLSDIPEILTSPQTPIYVPPPRPPQIRTAESRKSKRMSNIIQSPRSAVSQDSPRWIPPPRPRSKILFYHKHDPYYGFTNFSNHPVVYQGKKYPTSEHLFQSFKVSFLPGARKKG